MIASNAGYLDAVKVLVAAGADVNAKEEVGVDHGCLPAGLDS